jgi:hypothetical protein
MGESKKGSIKMQGKTLKDDGDYDDKEISFATQNDTDVCGFGLPVSLEAGKKMIDGFQKELIEEWADAKSALADANPVNKNEKEQIVATLERHPIAITLGKESLLYIMSQKDCEGIRFYFCKNHDTELSLVACGVKSNPVVKSNPFVGSSPVSKFRPMPISLGSTAKDLGAPEGSLSISDAEVKHGLEVVEGYFLFEVGPPTRLKDVLSKSESGNNNDVFEEELRSKLQKLTIVPLISTLPLINKVPKVSQS